GSFDRRARPLLAWPRLDSTHARGTAARAARAVRRVAARRGRALRRGPAAAAALRLASLPGAGALVALPPRTRARAARCTRGVAAGRDRPAPGVQRAPGGRAPGGRGGGARLSARAPRDPGARRFHRRHLAARRRRGGAPPRA